MNYLGRFEPFALENRLICCFGARVDGVL